MKTHTKISTLAVVYALCAGVAMPAFAAPSVRALGGAGTYSSASSATQAKTGTASTAQKAETVRGGSLSVDSGTSSAGAKTVTNKVSGTVTGARGSSARSASVRVPSSARLSIGKYLGGASVSKPSMPEKEEPTPGVSEDFIEYQISYDENTHRLTIYDKTNRVEVMSRDVASHRELENLREDLTELENLVGSGELDTEAATVIAAINELVAGKQDKLTAGEGININGDEISVNLIGENGITVDGNVIGFEGGDLQSKLNAGDGITIDANNNITANIGDGLKFENGKIVTDIKLPTTDLPEVVQEKLVQGNYITITPDPNNANQSVISTTLRAGDGIAISDDGVVSTTIKLPTTDLPEVVQEKLVQGNYISITPDPNNANQSVISTTLRAGDGIAISDDGVISTTITLPEGGVQEKLNAGTGIKIDGNTISTNLEAGSMIQIKASDTDPLKQEISVVGLPSNLDGFVVYQPGDGVVFEGENNDTIAANVGDGLKIEEDKIKVNILPDGQGGLVVQDGVLKTKIDLPNAPVQEKLNAGANITIVPDSENQGQMIISATDTTYEAGDGIAITDGVISTTAKLPESGEVQAKLTAGKYINIDENNVITTTLKESDSIKIGEDGTITASVPLKEYTGGNGIDVAADGTITTKLLSSNSEQLNINYDESGNAVFTLNVPGLDGNTQYTAGAGLNLDGNEFRLSATESGMFLYTYNADTKQGSWQQVEIVDETAVDTSAEATN